MKNYRLLTYKTKNEDTNPGLLVNDVVVDIVSALAGTANADPSLFSSVISILESWDTTEPVLSAIAELILSDSPTEGTIVFPLLGVKLAAPVLYPNTIYCAGGNYHDHVMEMTGEKWIKEDLKPYFFLKAARQGIIGPNAEIQLVERSEKMDWEAELAVIIGRTAKNISAENTMDYVAGYSIINDVSARDLNKRTDIAFFTDWFSSKSFDSSAPLGPWITPVENIVDPQNLKIDLYLNDELQQDTNTNQMIFDIKEQIEYLSHQITLLPGDVIATGTGAGCGVSKGLFLKSGDRIKIDIEGVGTLENSVA